MSGRGEDWWGKGHDATRRLDFTHKPVPPNAWWDDGVKPIGKILDSRGNVIKVVTPERQPFGFTAGRPS